MLVTEAVIGSFDRRSSSARASLQLELLTAVLLPKMPMRWVPLLVCIVDGPYLLLFAKLVASRVCWWTFSSFPWHFRFRGLVGIVFLHNYRPEVANQNSAIRCVCDQVLHQYTVWNPVISVRVHQGLEQSWMPGSRESAVFGT